MRTPLRSYTNIRHLQHGWIRTNTIINLLHVYSATEDGYGDQRGNYPATRITGAFGEFTLDISLDRFYADWNQIVLQSTPTFTEQL